MIGVLIDENNIVQNVIVVEDNTFTPPDGLTALFYNERVLAYIGYPYDPTTGTFVAPPPEVPEPEVPTSITRPQAAKQLLVMGLITDDEAIAMAQSGIAPAFVRQHINTDLSAPDRVPAMIDFARYTYDRGHPLLAAMAAGNNFTEEAVDEFFRQAATL